MIKLKAELKEIRIQKINEHNTKKRKPWQKKKSKKEYRKKKDVSKI